MHVHPPPRAERNFFSGPNLQGKVVNAPLGRARVQFLRKMGDVDAGRGYLGSFSVCFEGDN